jgi:DNA repair protein RecO (recombination protein O)
MKGVRSPKKKLSPLVYQVGSFIEAQVYLRSRPGLELVSQPYLITPFHFQGDKLFLWKKSLVLVDDFVPQARQDASDVLKLLLVTGETLSRTDNLPVLEIMFTVHVLSLLGFGPFLDRCLVCGAKEHLRYFSGKLGGVLCTRCRTKESSSISLPFTHIEILRFLRRLPFDQTSMIKYLPDNVHRSLKRSLNEIVVYHMG